jgi:hypothetical protein
VTGRSCGDPALVAMLQQLADPGWVVRYAARDGDAWQEDRRGVAWPDAPVPRRWHACRAQTRGFTGPGDYFERCACGGIRLDRSGPWLEKNTRSRRDS